MDASATQDAPQEVFGPQGLIDFEDPTDAAIAWEFNLWRRAEVARFQAELNRIESERADGIREEFARRRQEELGRHNARLSSLEDLGASVQEATRSTQQKIAEYKSAKQQCAADVAEVAGYLRRQIAEAEAASHENASEAEAVLAAEAARADQLGAQALFFQEEGKKAEARRKAEGVAFTEFLGKLGEAPQARLQEELGAKQRELDVLAARKQDLEKSLSTLSAQLQERIGRVAVLKNRLDEQLQ